jgi:uncharacterized membrane protein YraQ (UPF0718 family)
MKIKKPVLQIGLIACFFGLILISFAFHFEPGKRIGFNFLAFFLEMLKILPCAFILIGLFEVWVKKESVENHLGQEAGPLAYLWVILLAGTTIGGAYVAFPVAFSLYKKGAKFSVVLTYIGASAICRIPMTIFEASFLGIRFSLIRLLTSIPLVIASSIWLGSYLEKRNMTLPIQNDQKSNR